MDTSSLIGFLHQFPLMYSFLGSLLVLVVVGYSGAPFVVWALAALAIAVGFGASPVVLGALAILGAIGTIKPIRTIVLSKGVLSLFQKLQLIPKISDTERTALEAGVVWVESELFSGKPDFKKILKETYPELTAEEKKGVSEKIDQLCAQASDWEMWQTRELPEAAWKTIKDEKLFGMIIPKEHGGLGYSALAHSEVIHKISSRGVGLSVLVMVPNSLGPAELLMHYGTEAQKEKYLSRLASGEEIPCFALTEPGAGSDAGSLTSSGELFKDENGELKIRLNWNKRWITLAAVSTILGVAFRLRDPNNYLGKGEDVGITCALIPTKTPGVVVGRRHDPLGVPFYNCPTQGHDVVIGMEQVVGEENGCGHGWTMLMDCLSAGRGISLPSQSAGAGKLCSRVVSAHAVNRKQFGVSIGQLEGVQDPIARIVGYTYILEANRKFTAGAIDNGIKPPVITAMAKYYSTEMMRTILNDAMDVLGGAGISRGPRNSVASGYTAAPIAITVEGANIMTRTLIIFGQGALRAHPYAYQEVAAVEANDASAFDKAFWGHIGHIVRNTFRSFVLSFTRGRLASTPSGPLKRYYQKLAWSSATFAILADIAMGSLGGGLKTRGKLTGRFADVLSWMYLATAVMRRYEAEGKKEDLPIVEYALTHALSEMQQAFDGIFQNIGLPGFGILGWWSRMNTLTRGLSDKQTYKVSHLIQQDTPQRDRLTEGMYLSPDPKDAVTRLDIAFKATKACDPIEKKIRKAIRAKQMPKVKGAARYEEAHKAQVISQEEFDQVQKAFNLRWDAIQVDDFTQEEYIKHAVETSTDFTFKKPGSSSTAGEGKPPLSDGHASEKV